MKTASIVVLALLLLAHSAHAADIVELDQESKEKADALKGAVLKPLNIFLYVLFGIAGTICLIFMGINAIAYMKAKSPTDRMEAEERLKYTAIGLFICIFGPVAVRTLL